MSDQLSKMLAERNAALVTLDMDYARRMLPTASSVVKSIGDDSRENIIERAKKLRAEISQTFAEAEHWNRVNVPWKGPAIDPDPDGQLKRIADGIDRMLASESPNVNVTGSS